MLTEKTFDAGAVTLNYAEGPPSGSPLVLLHGLTTRWQNFLPVLPLFMARYHTYAVDRRGHGQSGRTPGAYTVGEDAADIIAFLRERVTEPAVLLGHSGGAMTALVTAAQAPERVRAVVLEDPPLPEFSGDLDSATIQPFRDWFPALRQVITMEGSRAEKLAALQESLPQVDASRLRAYLSELSQCDPEHLTFAIEGKKMAGWDLQEVLAAVQCPVLLLHGNPEQMGTLTARDGELVASRLADCTRVYLEDVGHYIHAGQPAPFFRMVSNFLESVLTSSFQHL